MTNAEAITILRGAVAEVEWEYPMEIAAAIDKAIDALAKDNNVPNKWISVKYGMPEEDVDVLVWNGVAHQIAAYTTNPQKKWYGYSGNEILVEYWMPLPEPPKEET